MPMDYHILLLLCELVMWYYQSGLNKGLLFHSMQSWVSFQEMIMCAYKNEVEMFFKQGQLWIMNEWCE